jgi:hypothetical protein
MTEKGYPNKCNSRRNSRMALQTKPGGSCNCKARAILPDNVPLSFRKATGKLPNHGMIFFFARTPFAE